MEKTYNPSLVEEEIYSFWEKGGYFTPRIPSGQASRVPSRQAPKTKKPFSIILPLPNASDPMHMGHAVFTIEDIMCRYHRMLGEPVLWLPGSDHAGIETQFVFEKKLKKEGKSRFDFDRQTLHKMIWDFVEENREINIHQMEKLGLSLDWTRYHYSLEPKILENVFATFRKLYHDGLIYRKEKIVNYCTYCGTAFSELEVDHLEKDEFLYFLDYGPISIATTRPETIFADVAVAVNPKDKKFTKLIGQKATVPLINKEVPIIADELVDVEFGTGALKITPAHDATDFEIGQKHGLQAISCINSSGKMINVPEEIQGLSPKVAREKTIELLKQATKLIKTEPLHHTVGFCYRCKNVIEPFLMPQWFVKIEPLAKPAISAAEEGKVKFFPLRFKKSFLEWMKNIRDWNISRQIVWGPRIPAWYCLDCNLKIKINFLDKDKNLVSGFYSEIKDKYNFEEIKNGLQSLTAPVEAKFVVEETENCPDCQGNHFLQETDTFDTWFLSGQWPLNTLGFNVENPSESSEDFKYFYPTSVMDTLWDILFFWVARMIMFGLYLAGDVPFKTVHLHARVVDKHGQKMSKSKGNVVDPLTMTDKFGTDALRMSLVFGIAPASDIVVSGEKIRSMRNFANKVWNAARFVLSQSNMDKISVNQLSNPCESSHPDDKWILDELDKTVKSVTKQIETYHFGQAAEEIYDFFWHTFCDKYIEMVKPRLFNKEVEDFKPDPNALNTLYSILNTSLRLLHPFMPFITEKIWSLLPNQKEPIIISSWPEKF